jgi:histidinol-phosphate aminotransferase
MSIALTRRRIMQGTLGSLALAAAPVQASTSAQAGPTIRLYLNENPYGPSDRAKQAMRDALDDGWMYSHEDAAHLRRLIAAKEGLKPENVFICEGSTELLRIAGMVFCGDGREIVAGLPTFTAMPQYASRSGGVVRWVELNGDMQLDLAAMDAKVNERTGAVYICNPNNPTGSAVDSDQLRGFIEAASQRTLVVVDEAYIDLADDPEKMAMTDQLRLGRNVLIARTFSKMHGLAGLRIGYGLARPEIVRRLEEMRMSIPNRMGLKAAIASYQDAEFQEYSRKMVRAALAYTCGVFDKMKLRYAPTQANFVLFDTGHSGAEFATFLRERHIMVNPVFEPYDSWCRVSMGRMEHMEAFAVATRAFFKKT